MEKRSHLLALDAAASGLAGGFASVVVHKFFVCCICSFSVFNSLCSLHC